MNIASGPLSVAFHRDVIDELADLRERNVALTRQLADRDQLREENRQLREALSPFVSFPPEWCLTAHQTCILCSFLGLNGNILPRARLMTTLYVGREHQPDPAKILDAHMCKIRRTLRDAGVPLIIETVHGRGWRLSAESDAFLRANARAS